MSAESSPVPLAEESQNVNDDVHEDNEEQMDEENEEQSEDHQLNDNDFDTTGENVGSTTAEEEQVEAEDDQIYTNIDSEADTSAAIDEAPASNDYMSDKDPTTEDVNDNDNDNDDEDVITVRRKVIVNSDDDDEGEVEAGSEPSPNKRKVQLSSDDESDNEEKKADNVEKKKPRNLLGSDLSDSDNEGGQHEEVGELMANIFGDDSDEEGDGGSGAAPPEVDNQDEGGDEVEYRKRDIDEEDNTFESDFDIMMRRKKAERKRVRRRRGDGIDIINDDDGRIAAMVEAMKNATKDDRLANMERRPALRKRKMLPEVKTLLLRADMTEAMIENGMMSAVSDWLSPLPDKSLPALEIRTELLKLLQDFARLDQGVLKQSGLGKAVMMLFKHPKEIKQNKELAARLIRAWSRPIFQLDTDFRAISREEREHRDQERMPEAKRRRMSTEAGSSRQKDQEEELKPGDKGYIGRARVPRPSTKDYVVRPKHVVEGEFKGEKKGRAFARLDKAQRDFNERTKKLKTKRAVQVSLEGRNLAI